MAYLRLTRPANIVTAIADILAGIAVAGAAAYLTFTEVHADKGPGISSWLWLCLSTIGLYGGGVAFNDVFDAELDRIERQIGRASCRKVTDARWRLAQNKED